MTRTLAVAAVALFALAGCTGYVTTTPGVEVEVSGVVNKPDGKPLTGLNVIFHPAEAGAQPTGFPLKADGSFSGKMIAGKYRYFVGPAVEGDKKADPILKGLPDAYKTPDDSRTVDVRGGKVELKF